MYRRRSLLRAARFMHAFETMLLLETDLLRGAASSPLRTSLSQTMQPGTPYSTAAQSTQTRWQGRSEARPRSPTSTSQDFFTALDHMAAFDALDELDDADGRWLHYHFRRMMGWRVNLWNEEIYERFGQITREATGILLDKWEVRIQAKPALQRALDESGARNDALEAIHRAV